MFPIYQVNMMWHSSWNDPLSVNSVVGIKIFALYCTKKCLICFIWVTRTHRVIIAASQKRLLITSTKRIFYWELMRASSCIRHLMILHFCPRWGDAQSSPQPWAACRNDSHVNKCSHEDKQANWACLTRMLKTIPFLRGFCGRQTEEVDREGDFLEKVWLVK